MTINLIGTNTLTGGSPDGCDRSAGVFVWDGALTINGSGTLNAIGGNVTYSYGVYTDGSAGLTISGGTINATSGTNDGMYVHGIRSNNGITISGGTINATGGAANGFSYGVYNSGSPLTISGGTINATANSTTGYGVYGIYNGNSFSISGGTVNATGGTVAKAESKPGSYGININDDYQITISAGTVEATGNTQALNKAPVLTGNITTRTTIVSEYIDGSSPADSYDSESISTYKYFKTSCPPVSIFGKEMTATADTPSYYTGSRGSAGEVTTTTLADGDWKAKLELVDGKYKLTLNELDIAPGTNPAGALKSNENLQLHLAQSNKRSHIVTNGRPAIDVHGSLLITAHENSNNTYLCAESSNSGALKVTGDLTVNGAKFTSNAYTANEKNGDVSSIYVNGNLTVGANSVISIATKKNVGANGNEDASYAAKVTGNVVMNGSSLNCETGCGIGLNADGTITLNSGNITFSGSTKALNKAPLLSGYSSYEWTTDNAETATYQATSYTHSNADTKFLSIRPAASGGNSGGGNSGGNSGGESGGSSGGGNSGGSSGSGSGSSSSTVTVYNNPSQPQATVWLTGSGLTSGDMLVTERNPQGSAFNALLRLANGGDVFNTYNISLSSGKKSTGSAMNITFDLDSKYAGQSFTLVHQKADGSYEYFYTTADAFGNLSFGPLYELSPFMLVQGKLAQTAFTSLADVPKTGDSTHVALWTSVVLLVAAASLAGVALRKRHD